VRKKDSSASDRQVGFVWESGEAATADTAEAAEAAAPRRVLRPRTILIGSISLVVLAGAAYGADALSTNGRHHTTGAAALLQPSPRQTDAAASPSAGPVPTKRTTPLKTSAAASPRAAVVVEPTSAVVAPATTQPAAPPTLPPAAGDWLLNQKVGNTAVDSTGAHDGIATDGWWAGTAFLANGSNSQIYTNGPVLSTGPGDSFTVSAWADVTVAPASAASAVSQDGTVNSAFSLQLTEPADRWAFVRASSDGDGSATARALSQSSAALNTWTHLVGVYDAASGTETLYVDGVQQSSAKDSTPFPADGDLAMGRALSGGNDADWLQGAIRDVEVFSSALDGAQVAELN
jgi:hypothetical protein